MSFMEYIAQHANVLAWFAMALAWLGVGVFVYIYGSAIPWAMAYAAFMSIASSVFAYFAYSKRI